LEDVFYGFANAATGFAEELVAFGKDFFVREGGFRLGFRNAARGLCQSTIGSAGQAKDEGQAERFQEFAVHITTSLKSRMRLPQGVYGAKIHFTQNVT
jgi:hypothetical protein